MTVCWDTKTTAHPMDLVAFYSIEDLKQILNENNVNLHDKYNNSVLAYVDDDKVELVEYLISCGANVNNVNITGITPLMAATSRDSFKVMQLLIQNGADVTKQAYDGCNFMHYLVTAFDNVTLSKGMDIVKKLIDDETYEIVFKAKNNNGESPEDILMMND